MQIQRVVIEPLRAFGGSAVLPIRMSRVAALVSREFTPVTMCIAWPTQDQQHQRQPPQRQLLQPGFQALY